MTGELKWVPAVLSSDGVRRVIGGFLWWPMCATDPLTDKREVRWFCNAEWIEEYFVVAAGDYYGWSVYCWKPEVW